ATACSGEGKKPGEAAGPNICVVALEYWPQTILSNDRGTNWRVCLSSRSQSYGSLLPPYLCHALVKRRGQHALHPAIAWTQVYRNDRYLYTYWCERFAASDTKGLQTAGNRRNYLRCMGAYVIEIIIVILRNVSFLTGKERDNETGLDYFQARYYS